MKVLGPESSRAIAPDVAWWVCQCGRLVYDHSIRTVPNTGGREYVCTETASGRFEPTDPAFDYAPETGLTRKTR